MLTIPAEREKIMCLENCMKDGKVEPLCAATKCGKAAVECLGDDACRKSVECVPRALLACSKPALNCVLGRDAVCHDNLQCLTHGVTQCLDPAVNLLTDSNIADLVTCAGSKCPHPASTPRSSRVAAVLRASQPEQPSDLEEQLLCVASKCGSGVRKIFGDEDTKELTRCALQSAVPGECSSVWKCLGDPACNAAIKCWAKPFDVCKEDVWKVLTMADERKRIENGLSCVRGCEQDHRDDFVGLAFCMLDRCGQGLLDCWKDATCRGAVKCLPDTAASCAVQQLDTYVHNELFRNSTKCFGHSLESCGRGAVEMLRLARNVASSRICWVVTLRGIRTSPRQCIALHNARGYRRGLRPRC